MWGNNSAWNNPIHGTLLRYLWMNEWTSYVLNFGRDFHIEATRTSSKKGADDEHKLELSIQAWARIIWLASSNSDFIELLIDDSENIEFDEEDIKWSKVKKVLRWTKAEVSSIAWKQEKHSPIKKNHKILKIPMHQFMTHFMEQIDSYEKHEVWKEERWNFSKKTRKILQSRNS